MLSLLLSRVWLFATPWTVATRLLRPWDSPGKNTEVACDFLLQWIFPIQGSNPGLPHCGQTLKPLSHQGSPSPAKYRKDQIKYTYLTHNVSGFLCITFFCPPRKNALKLAPNYNGKQVMIILIKNLCIQSLLLLYSYYIEMSIFF